MPAAATLAGILITDIVGSTQLRARLGDQRADGVRRNHERLLRSVVTRHRGRVVQWRGDGILAAFPSVSAAARAAIAIQQAIDRENNRPQRLAVVSVRIGLSGGEVLLADGACDGPVEREATALCDAAAGGEIRASQCAIELIGSREALRTRVIAAGSLVIEWQPIRGAEFRLDIAPALRTLEHTHFVGREKPLTALRGALRAAVGGDPRLVVVQGDAGIGKTRLIAEFAREAIEQGVVVLFGSAHEDLAIPYEPIARALRSWMESVEDLAIRLGPRSGELVRLVPELAEWVPDLPPPTPSDAETERLCLYDAVGEWIATAALDDPVLLVLDSLHFATNPTFELLRHALRMLADSRVLIVTTQRPGDERTVAIQQWGHESLGAGSVSVLELAGLRKEDVAQLVEQGAVTPQALALAGAIHLVTGGNPLHVGALLRRDADANADGADLPASVRAALRSNVDRLDPAVHGVLETASVLGEEFDGALLSALLGDADRTYDALETAERAGLLREVDRRALRYRFSHALTRDTLYESIGAGRLARMHESAALLLEGRRDASDDSLIPDLARHFTAAAALGYRDRAAHYAAEAARCALDQYANEQAAELFAEALQLAGAGADPGLRCDRMIGRGEALRRMGDPSHRALLVDAAELAVQLRDGERAGRALLASYRGTFSHALRVDARHVARLRAALEQIGTGCTPMRARLLALLAVELVWAEDRNESRRTSDEAIAVAREAHDDELVAQVLTRRQWTVFDPIGERLRTTHELADLALSSPDPLLRFESAGTEVFTYIRSGDRAALESAIISQRVLATEIDQPIVRWMLLISESTVALLEGRLADADAAIESGRALGHRTGQPDVDAQYAAQRFWLDFERKPPALARARIERLARHHEQLPPFNLSSIAFRCCDLGLDPLAAPIAARIAAGALSSIPVDMLWLPTMCQIAATAAHLVDVESGRELLDRLVPYAEQHGNMMFATMGSVARYVGLLCRLLDRPQDAERWLLAAEHANEKLGAVTWLARTRVDLAELRFACFGSDDPRGCAALEAAASAAAALGLATVSERASRLRAG